MTPVQDQIEWRQSHAPVAYDDAVSFMEQRVSDIHENRAPGCVWLLEHPALYTGGTSAKAQDLLSPSFPVHATGRGGEYTYHGPGQRVAYVMMDLKKMQKTPDLRAYIHTLEEWVIRALKEFDIAGERRAGRVGIWVDLKKYGRPGEAKIAAIGVRVRKWVAYHGVSINVNPDLSHYAGIVPCGIAEHGVTSFSDLGIGAAMTVLDQALQRQFNSTFYGVE